MGTPGGGLARACSGIASSPCIPTTSYIDIHTTRTHLPTLRLYLLFYLYTQYNPLSNVA